MLRAGQYQLVLQEAEERFAQLRWQEEPDGVWLLVGAAWAATQLRRWGQAVVWADRGLAYASSDLEARGWLHFYAGYSLAHTGDLLRARKELQQFQIQAKQVPCLKRLDGSALYNLAYVARALGDQEQEIDLFRQAARAYQVSGLEGKALACRYEIGWSYLLAGCWEKALPELEAVAEKLLDNPDGDLETDLLIARGLAASLQGDLEESDRICGELLSRDLAPQRAADVNWILGCNALKRGAHSEAADRLSDAYNAALSFWWPPQIERVDAALRRIPSTQLSGR